MNWIDILILLILLFAIVMGIWRGFIHEVLSLTAWIAAFIFARVFAPDVALWLGQWIESQALILLLSWLLPFLTTFMAFTLLKFLLISLITVVGLRPIDRLLGAAFGAIKGMLLVTAGVLIIQLVLSRSGEPFETESRLVPHFQVIALWMLKTLDQETELSIDKVVNKLGSIIDSSAEKVNLNSWGEKFGLATDELSTILKDDKKLAQLKALLEDPEALNSLQQRINAESCQQDDCNN